MKNVSVYHDSIPEFLSPFLNAPEMLRLQDIGMNCGCEYTSFQRFSGLEKYSRFEHSLGAALIVWHFTEDKKQTLAALFHDIATPVFAHSVDFLHGDYMTQESTEEGTEEIIRGSIPICSELERLGIATDSVKDYHLYPIADNESPRLSSDRLEYTLGNSIRYGFSSVKEIRAVYSDIAVSDAGDGQPELAFQNSGMAEYFAETALKCSRVYVSPEDRYSMQMLSELLGEALKRNVIDGNDLFAAEAHVIGKMCSDKDTARMWCRFCSQSKMTESVRENSCARVIHAKKRYIDPLVIGKGRLSSISADFRSELDAFLNDPQNEILCSDAYF